MLFLFIFFIVFSYCLPYMLIILINAYVTQNVTNHGKMLLNMVKCNKHGNASYPFVFFYLMCTLDILKKDF